ncbi:MAG: hypothetical protein OXU20_15695 [Myxococcales bacterium]|nr:hypothetical protein [Myxococcales bacterium]
MTLVHINDAIVEMFESLVSEIESPGGKTRLPTGLPNLDAEHGGVRRGSLVRCLARDEDIRRDLAAALSLWHALRGGVDVVFVFPGAHTDNVARHLLAAASNVPLWQIETGQLSREDWPRLASAAGVMSELSLTLVPAAPGEPDHHVADEILQRVRASEAQTVIIAVDVHNLRATLLGDDAFTPACMIMLEEHQTDQPTHFSLRVEQHADQCTLALEGARPHAVQVHYDPLRRTFPTIARAFLEPEPAPADSEDVHDYPADEADWSSLTDDFPEELKLAEEPPPLAGLRHLTQDELRQVMAWAHRRASELGDPAVEPVIALFLAETMPRLKYAAHAGFEVAGITRNNMTEAVRVTHGGPVDYTAPDLLTLSGCLSLHTKPGHYEGQRRAASYRLKPGTINFCDHAPKKRIHPRPAETALEGRWNALQRAANTS